MQQSNYFQKMYTNIRYDMSAELNSIYKGYQIISELVTMKMRT